MQVKLGRCSRCLRRKLQSLIRVFDREYMCKLDCSLVGLSGELEMDLRPWEEGGGCLMYDSRPSYKMSEIPTHSKASK